MAKKIRRINVGQVGSKSPIAIPYLTELQKTSFDWFIKEGIAGVLEQVSPITDYTDESYALKIFDPRIEEPGFSSGDAIERGASYEVKLFAKSELTDLETGEVVEQEVFLGRIPQITERGTFVINGIERCVVSQLTRAPGVYFESSRHPVLGRNLYTAAIRPERGAWLEIITYRNHDIYGRINQKGRFPITALLKSFGVTHSDLRTMFGDVDVGVRSYIKETLDKDPSTIQEEALLEVYSKSNPGDPRILENAENFLKNSFWNPRYFSLGKIGRFKVNKRLNLSFPIEAKYFTLQKEDLIETVRELIRFNVQQVSSDDIDHLSNRRVRAVGELMRYSFERGVRMLERNIQERLSVTSIDKVLTPSLLVNSRPIVASVREFFGSSQLSQFMDQSNPLSEVEHLRRISALGPGGLTRERAGTAVRDVQPSHYGRLGIIKTPEGQNIGLNLALAVFARRNEYGFLETPYFKVDQKKDGAFVTKEIEYLTADEEEKYHIAESTVMVDEKGKILDKTITVRFRGDFIFSSLSNVDFVDVHSMQVVGVSSGLIPFISSDVGNRALMGANMQCQAVPLVKPRASRTGTGLEKRLIEDSCWGVFAKTDGVVEYVDGLRIDVKGSNGVKVVYNLAKFVRTNDNTCYNQTSLVRVGDKVKKGDPLVDGPSHEAGELALGRDLLIAFMPWDGFNYEDAIVVSERVIKEDLLTSIHIKTYESTVMETKLGVEEVTSDIPNVSVESLSNLGEDGVVVVGAQVGPGDVLVGKVAPKGESELTAEERLLRAIFGEKAREIRNTSLAMPHGERGRIISIRILDKESRGELGPGVLKIIRVDVAQFRKIKEGDKIAGRHGSKGVISRIVPDEDMPFMEDGTVVDVLLNPISILGRMNIGQIMEAHLGWAGEKLDEYYAVSAFDKLPRGFLEKKFKEAGLPSTGKVKLCDGRTGNAYKHHITVGFANVLKLHHLAEDKIHARSTGPYSLITQQPLGGKAQMGGQRLGEMEVWALEAYGAAHTLQEMLTIKSDDVVGRSKAFEAIIKGNEIPEARVPESFKLLVKELNSLCLDVQPLSLGDSQGED